MSDIRCVVCGEPWDAYGVRHGDMLAWEARLFRAGHGCPSCEGVSPATPPTFDRLDDFENGDDDPMVRLMARDRVESGAARPAWAAPEATVLWTCEGCGVQVVRDESECSLDGSTLTGDPIAYRLPPKARGRQWYSSHRYDSGDPEAEPFHKFGESPYCEFCVTSCGHCGERVSTQVEGDTYDPGWCAPHDAHGHAEVFCVDCHESGVLDEPYETDEPEEPDETTDASDENMETEGAS